MSGGGCRGKKRSLYNQARFQKVIKKQWALDLRKTIEKGESIRKEFRGELKSSKREKNIIAAHFPQKDGKGGKEVNEMTQGGRASGVDPESPQIQQ